MFVLTILRNKLAILKEHYEARKFDELMEQLK